VEGATGTSLAGVLTGSSSSAGLDHTALDVGWSSAVAWDAHTTTGSGGYTGTGSFLPICKSYLVVNGLSGLLTGVEQVARCSRTGVATAMTAKESLRRVLRICILKILKTFGD
jgi:hypothetical protein